MSSISELSFITPDNSLLYEGIFEIEDLETSICEPFESSPLNKSFCEEENSSNEACIDTNTIFDGLLLENDYKLGYQVGNKKSYEFDIDAPNLNEVGLLNVKIHSFTGYIDFNNDVTIYMSELIGDANVNFVGIDDYFFACYDNGRDASHLLWMLDG